MYILLYISHTKAVKKVVRIYNKLYREKAY